MFPRKSQSSDVLGSEKRRDAAPANTLEPKKSKSRLRNMRSFLFKSPKPSSPPVPNPRPPPQPHAFRLGGGANGNVAGGAGMSMALPSAHASQGLGIKHSAGPGATDGGATTRPVPHARMYNANSSTDAVSTDMFSTSRPPGMGMRLPPARSEARQSVPDFASAPAFGQGTPPAALAMTPDNASSARFEPLQQPESHSTPPAPTSEPLPSVPTFPETNASMPPAPTVVQVGPPSTAHESIEPMYDPTTAGVSLPDNAGEHVDFTQTTWPPYYADTMAWNDTAHNATMQAPHQSDSAGEPFAWVVATETDAERSAPPAKEATALVSPPVETNEPSANAAVSEHAPVMPPANPRGSLQSTSLTELDDGSYGVGDALVRPYYSTISDAPYRPESWTLPEPETMPSQGGQVEESNAGQARTSVRLENNTIMTAAPSLYEPPSTTESLPPIDILKMTSRDAKDESTPPSFPAEPHAPAAQTLGMNAQSPSMEDQVQPPSELTKVQSSMADGAQQAGASSQGEVPGGPVDAPDATQNLSAQESFEQYGEAQSSLPPEYFRVECMLGPYTLVYTDPVLHGMTRKPVAYTYDSWYIEPTTSLSGAQRAPSATAIVAASPSREEAMSVPLCLPVLASQLEQAENEQYVLDVARPLEFEVPPTERTIDSSKPVPLTWCLRNAALFSMSSHVVLASTPQRLVAEMTSGSSPGLMQDLFLGYRQYFNAPRLLDLLLQRTDWAIHRLGKPVVGSTAQRVLLHAQSAFWHWLMYYYEYDFQHDEGLTCRLVQWVARENANAASWPVQEGTSAQPVPPMHLPSQANTLQEPSEDLPSSDPRERMHAIYELVQTVVPPALLPPMMRDARPSEERKTGLSASRSVLRKSRSLSRMLSLTGGGSGSRRRTHLRKSSSVLQAGGAAGTVGATGAAGQYGPPTVSAEGAGNTSGASGPDVLSDTSLDTSQDVQLPSQIQRNRSLRSIRRMLSARKDQPDASDTGEKDDTRFSMRTKVDALMPDDDSDSEAAGHDAALQQLERALGDMPRPEDLHASAPARHTGPFHWIPRYNTSTWKEAQRMSVTTARTMQPHSASAAPSSFSESSMATRDSLMLSQRSSTIARQLGIIERELLSSVNWTELSEPSWDQHTVRQEQWQLEYQDYVSVRIRQAIDEHTDLARVHSAIQGKGIHMLIARFNRTCAWVASHIVRCSNIQDRVAIVNKFIRIAWHCYRQGNMESLCQIMFGLQSPWIARLQQTWEHVSTWELRAFEALRRFTSPREQFAFLRYSTREAIEVHIPQRRFTKVSSASAPYVPFFGLFVSDLSAIDSLSSFVDASGMPNTMPLYDDHELTHSWDALVNVYRMRIKSHIVREFVTLQRHHRLAPSHPIELPILIEALQLDTLSAVAIQSASLALEP